MARIKLVENVLVPASKISKLDVPLAEAALGDTLHKALAVYRFPFTRPGQKNMNGRIYPFKLWDRIFQLFRTKTTISLCNHPEDDGDPARIWAVLRNPGYSGDRTLGMVDCYILDNELGRTANGVLLAGGDIGLSSSGTGDFEADGITVDADTFELERFFDWVLNPSYSVFGTLDDIISEAVMADSVDKDNNAVENIREKSGGGSVKTLSLREKREFEASLKRIYEDVKSIAPFRERLHRAKEALTFYENTDVESYKGEFEELVKEAEKEFEAALAKSEQADVLEKEVEEKSQAADEAVQEAESLRNENESLKRENEALKKQVGGFRLLKEKADDMLSLLATSLRRSVSYSEYAKLRKYAVNATKRYSEMKNNHNLLQIQLQESEADMKHFEESRLLQLRKDAALQERMENARREKAEAKLLSEKRLLEAKEAAFLRGVNPDVLEYYNDLIRMGENVSGIRTQILSKRTLDEAQLFVLKAKRRDIPAWGRVTERDLSAPLPVTNCRQVLPDIHLTLPKGHI